MRQGYKIAICGKGGVGKTTIASGLINLFIQDGKKVVAVDCDPDINLGYSINFPDYQNIIPIVRMKELIAERTESSPNSLGGFFKLNPRVDDIPEKFCPESKGVRLIVMGKVSKAAGGCLCPENSFTRSLINHLILSKDQVVVMDIMIK